MTPTLPAAPAGKPRSEKGKNPLRALLDSLPVRRLQHGLVLRLEKRRSYTFTRFLRLPQQYAALAGPVVDFLAPALQGRPLEIVAIGSSVGAQPFSAIATLRLRRPSLEVRLRGYDIDPEVIRKAQAGRYSAKDVGATPTPPPEFIAATFDREGETYVVKPEIRACAQFAVGDVFDPSLPEQVGTADVVCCQNLLVNLPRRDARRAFRNVVRLLRPRAALFVDGMDFDLRARLTREAGLEPLDWKIPEIHEEVRALHGAAWPWHYWGVEPFARRGDWRRRYATIFLNGAP